MKNIFYTILTAVILWSFNVSAADAKLEYTCEKTSIAIVTGPDELYLYSDDNTYSLTFNIGMIKEKLIVASHSSNRTNDFTHEYRQVYRSPNKVHILSSDKIARVTINDRVSYSCKRVR